MKQILDLTLRHIRAQAWMRDGARESFRALKPVLQGLAEIHDEYVHQESNPNDHRELYDWAFWHKERPQIGLLAAAVWRKKGVALEEFGLPKRSWKGRCDLWLRAGKANFECEAKYCWLVGKPNKSKLKKAKWVKEYEKNLKAATDAADELTAPNRLALVFGALAATPPKHSDAFLATILEKIQQQSRRLCATHLLITIRDNQTHPPIAQRDELKRRKRHLGLLVSIFALPRFKKTSAVSR